MRYKKIRKFTDLVVWKKGHQLVILIYKLTRKFPKKEIYGLSNQIQRASVSITSNIAEGFGRKSVKEKSQFYNQARGSLIEVKNQLLIAKDLKYINKNNFKKANNLLTETHKLLNKLISTNDKK